MSAWSVASSDSNRSNRSKKKSRRFYILRPEAIDDFGENRLNGVMEGRESKEMNTKKLQTWEHCEEVQCWRVRDRNEICN